MSLELYSIIVNVEKLPCITMHLSLHMISVGKVLFKNENKFFTTRLDFYLVKVV
jgi:hypothetical protein